jgi:hypothetical protein
MNCRNDLKESLPSTNDDRLDRLDPKQVLSIHINGSLLPNPQPRQYFVPTTTSRHHRHYHHDTNGWEWYSQTEQHEGDTTSAMSAPMYARTSALRRFMDVDGGNNNGLEQTSPHRLSTTTTLGPHQSTVLSSSSSVTGRGVLEPWVDDGNLQRFVISYVLLAPTNFEPNPPCWLYLGGRNHLSIKGASLRLLDITILFIVLMHVLRRIRWLVCIHISYRLICGVYCTVLVARSAWFCGVRVS